MTLSEAYLILSINQSSSLEELKKKYRLLAKKWHPDINTSANAHEVFVKINLAFHTILRDRSEEKLDKEIVKEYDAYVNKKSQQYSNTSFYEFENSQYFKSQTNFRIVLFHLQLFLTLVAAIFFGYLCTLFGAYSFVFYILGGVLASFFLIYFFNLLKTDKVDFKSFLNATRFLDNTEYFYLGTICAVFNLLGFLKYYFSTFIPSYVLVLTYLAIFGICYFFVSREKYQIQKPLRFYYSFFLAPMILSALVLINYTFSFYIYTEKIPYQSVRESDTENPFYVLTLTTLKLEGDKYKHFQGIRTFSNNFDIKNAKDIDMDIARGIFGIKVLKHYSFDARKPLVNH